MKQGGREMSKERKRILYIGSARETQLRREQLRKNETGRQGDEQRIWLLFHPNSIKKISDKPK
jgi:hypothetical protein